MIIDKSILDGGFTPRLLNDLISQHEQGNARIVKLRDYYLGHHTIESRQKKSSAAANNRVVCNHAKYIVDVAQSYLAGNPVMYTAREGVDIEAVKNAYFRQDIAEIDSTIVNYMATYGSSIELIYANEAAELNSYVLDNTCAFVCYDNTASQTKLCGIYYYRRYDLNNAVKGVVCYVYTPDEIIGYSADTDNWTALKEVSREKHYFGTVPMIEYINNRQRQGDFEQLISLIDAYNILQSDRVNDKEQFVESFLFLKNIEIDTEQAQKLREEKVLMGFEDSAAQYLSKVMSETDIEVLRDCIREDIHRFAMVPDLTDNDFGNNLSGVAIKYKLMGFEQHITNKERYFKKGLVERFKIYVSFYSMKGAMKDVDMSDVSIIFKRNLPANELEISQMVNNLRDIVSNETLLEQLEFIEDSKEEMNIIRTEKEEIEEKERKKLELIGGGHGYFE